MASTARTSVADVDVENGDKGISHSLASTWMVEHADDNDLFSRILRKYYFPVLTRFHKHICVLWLAGIVICAVFGPAFMSLTRDNLDLPPGTPSAIAQQVFNDNYPDYGTWPPAIIVQSSLDDRHIIRPKTKEVADKLRDVAAKHRTAISNVSGYFEYLDDPILGMLATDSLGQNNRTVISTVSFRAD
eukprot:CAMPEP_0113714924 /NCGR_PEP_ID=MMETSP0038_2-20120614/32932_1 /TAXON_ID=2898 /ORGANISM="Cryptomonas paramecium" /LENGTH=187 /DNA_ID=CAMNT_0000642045 /DNA_START=109 /DNA_END=669 /DNA_ORIENTATION=- /assembly_acc=CAM_ASM_000170